LPIASKPKPEWSVGKTLACGQSASNKHQESIGTLQHIVFSCFFFYVFFFFKMFFLPLRTSKTRNICHQTQGDTTI
jgi:hypothetical protein